MNFLHSGGAGDIIWSLPFVKSVLGEDKAVFYIKRKMAMNNAAVDIYESIKDLLLTQDFVEQVIPVDDKYGIGQCDPEIKIDYNLDHFRAAPNIAHFLLPKTYFFALQKPLPDNWKDFKLKATPYDILRTEPYFLINRTFRYRSPEVNWKEIVGDNHKKFLFIGMHDEYADFCRVIGSEEVRKFDTRNFFEVAKLIAGCEALYCNLTASNAIAYFLDKPVFLELAPQHSNAYVNDGKQTLLNPIRY